MKQIPSTDIWGNVKHILMSEAEETGQTIGTSLVGEIDFSYKDLVKTFGKPTSKGDEYKIDAEWLVMTPVGPATIYNWKDGKNYCGKAGTATTKITAWHIGGRDEKVASYVLLALLRVC